MKPFEPTIEERNALLNAIAAARTIQTFLWGEANGEWGLEEWLRMFRKRVAKLEEVQRDNPHAAVELKKRLLQTAALSIALIGIIDRDGVPWAAQPHAPPSNLPQFDQPVAGPPCVVCHARPATQWVNTVVDRCELQRLHVCDDCAAKCHDINRQFAG